MQKRKSGPKTNITTGIHVGTYLKRPAYAKIKAEALRRQRSISFILRELVEAHVSK